MGKLERQQKKLEAMREKEEKKRLKEEERRAKKETRKSRVKVPKIDIRAEKTESSEEAMEFKPKSTNWKKPIAVILWLIIAFFVVQGVVAVVNRETSDDLKKTMDSYYQTLSDTEASQMEAGTFTASFLREFYTYDSENDTWNERVGKYLALGAALDEPNGVDGEKLINSEIRRITVNDKQIDVDAYVEVEYQTSTSDGENQTEKVGTLKHLIRVPVAKVDGNYAVVSAPIYISDANRAAQVEYDMSSLKGDAVGREYIGVIETTASNFLKAYYGKKPSELKYYVTKDFGNLATVGGTMSFVKVTKCDAVKTKNGYTVRADIVINNGFNDINETMFLEMVKGEEDRLYIDKVKTRQ